MRILELKEPKACAGLGVIAQVTLKETPKEELQAFATALRAMGFRAGIPASFRATAEISVSAAGEVLGGGVFLDSEGGGFSRFLFGTGAREVMDALIALDGKGGFCVCYSEANPQCGVLRRAKRLLGEGSEAWLEGIFESEAWERGEATVAEAIEEVSKSAKTAAGPVLRLKEEYGSQ